jgi:hypothetical protein
MTELNPIALHYEDEENWQTSIGRILMLNLGFSEVVLYKDNTLTPLGVDYKRVGLVVSDSNGGKGNEFIQIARQVVPQALFVGLSTDQVEGVDISFNKSSFRRNDFVEEIRKRLG